MTEKMSTLGLYVANTQLPIKDTLKHILSALWHLKSDRRIPVSADLCILLLADNGH